MHGGEEFSLPVVHSRFFYCALQKPYDGLDVVGSLPFTCCACRPHFIYLREKAELSALPSMFLPSSPESTSATSIPKRGSYRGDPSAAPCSLPSLWPLLCTRFTVTDHKVPTPPWKMPNTWRNSIVGSRPTLLRVTNAHSKSRRGSRTSFEIPPPPLFFFVPLKWHPCNCLSFLVWVFNYVRVLTGVKRCILLGRTGPFLCAICGTSAVSRCTAVSQRGNENAPSCVWWNLPKVSKNKKKWRNDYSIYASVVCSMLGVRVLWLVQIEVPWSISLPSRPFVLFPPPLFLLFSSFHPERSCFSFSASCGTVTLCNWHNVRPDFETKWVQGGQLHYTHCWSYSAGLLMVLYIKVWPCKFITLKIFVQEKFPVSVFILISGN